MIVGPAMHGQSVRGKMSATEYNERVDSFVISCEYIWI